MSRSEEKEYYNKLKETMKLAPPASWVAFRTLCKDWRLEHAQGVAILHLSKLHLLSCWNFEHEMLLATSHLERLSYLLAIHHELKRLDPDPLVLMNWLHLECKSGIMDNTTPFQFMCKADCKELGLLAMELMAAKNQLDLF